MTDRHNNSDYWSRLVRLFLVALIFGITLGLGGYVALTSAVYAHLLTHPGCRRTPQRPADVGLTNAESIQYPSHDGIPIDAWYVPPQNGTVILLIPGLTGARERVLSKGSVLAEHGYGLLLTDLRSCATEDGMTTLGHHESRDVEQAVDWITDQPEVERVGALGYSLGGVSAVLAAARDPRVEAVVNEGGFYDLAGDIRDEGNDPSLWKRAFYEAVLFFYRLETGIDPEQVSTINVIDQIAPRPLLLIYGEREVGSGRAVEQLEAAGERKRLWVVPGCGHGNYLAADPEGWEETVVGFFDGAFGGQ